MENPILQPQQSQQPQQPQKASEPACRQIIEDRYIHYDRLKALLEKLFPSGNYNVEYVNNKWVLEIPRLLTEAELEDVAL